MSFINTISNLGAKLDKATAEYLSVQNEVKERIEKIADNVNIAVSKKLKERGISMKPVVRYEMLHTGMPERVAFANTVFPIVLDIYYDQEGDFDREKQELPYIFSVCQYLKVAVSAHLLSHKEIEDSLNAFSETLDKKSKDGTQNLIVKYIRAQGDYKARDLEYKNAIYAVATRIKAFALCAGLNPAIEFVDKNEIKLTMKEDAEPISSTTEIETKKEKITLVFQANENLQTDKVKDFLTKIIKESYEMDVKALTGNSIRVI